MGELKSHFDLDIPRAGSGAVKYDIRRQLFGTEDVEPMWVADTFGDEGEGFMRLNIALPRQRLQAALERMAVALSTLS